MRRLSPVSCVFKTFSINILFFMSHSDSALDFFSPLGKNEKTMFDDEVIVKILDQAAEDAKENLKKNKALSVEDAMPLILKSLYNHVAHLDEKMVTKGLFNEFKIATKDQFNSLKWLTISGLSFIGLCMAILASMQAYVTFFLL